MDMLRRTFLQSASGIAAAQLSPALGAGLALGFDSFSIRGFNWKAIQLLDYAAQHKLDSVQMSSLGDFESLDPAYLRKVRDHSERLGISIDAGIASICPSSSSYNKKEGTPEEYLTRGLKTANAVGSRVLRCYLGTRADRRGTVPLQQHIANTVKVLRNVRSLARDLNVTIAIENHAGDMQAREVKGLIEEAGKDFVGSCLDTGNPMWVIEDPMLTLETLGPYAVTTHIRDSVVFEHPRGAAVQWVALGDGNAIHFARFLPLYRKLCPKAVMQLEIITGRAPDVMNYLEPEFWGPFPNMPAWEFARFVALAKKGGPFLGAMLIAQGKQPPVIADALREQQRIDLERSLDYAKKVLGVGIRAHKG
jgi:sugar phosphate isomerase/epimerase